MGAGRGKSGTCWFSPADGAVGTGGSGGLAPGSALSREQHGTRSAWLAASGFLRGPCPAGGGCGVTLL